MKINTITVPADSGDEIAVRENLIVTELPDPWNDRAFLRDVQYRTDANLAARQSIYAYQHPHIDLQARVLDLAAPAPGETVADVGCGNGMYLAELARRGFAGRVLGLDLSPGMLAAARERLTGLAAGPDQFPGRPASVFPGPSASVRADPATVGVGSGGPGGPSGAVGPAGSAGRAGSATLLAADATALPIPDGAADLSLAMHMLYHVPEPARAVRELRRVTRPGGRVAIVLNGPGHLRELRAIVAAVRSDGQWGRRERLTLDDGEVLVRPYFSAVTRYNFVAELRVPGPEPIADYVRSMSGTQQSVDPEVLVASVVTRLPADPDAVFTVTTHAGCLICTV